MNEGAHIHANPRPAEAEALAAIAPHITGIKRRILEQAGAAGDLGVIPDEVDGLINTIRRRFTDLWKGGHLRPTKRTRKNRSGNSETVWILGRDENARGAGAKLHAKAMRDAQGAVAFLEGEYLEGRGVPGIIGWGTCMVHLLDKARARVAELEVAAHG